MTTMPMHLQDYMGQHPYLLWLSVIPLCWAAEVLLPKRVFVLWGLAAAIGGAVAAVAPTLWWLQLSVALVAGVLLQLLLRRRLLGDRTGTAS